MFLLEFVILFTGGGSASVHAGIPPDNPPSPGNRHRHTVNERPLRILLECILVFTSFTSVLDFRLQIFNRLQLLQVRETEPFFVNTHPQEIQILFSGKL